MSIITNAQFQQFLSVAGETMSSADIDIMIPVAEARLNSLCHRDFSLHWENETIEIETWDTRRYTVKTKNYPIVAGTVMLTNTSTLIANSALVIDHSAGIIKKRTDDSFFDTGRDAILLMYQTGYAEGLAPEDLQFLIYKIGFVLKSAPGVAYESEKAGDYSYKMSDAMLMTGLDTIGAALINKYLKVF